MKDEGTYRLALMGVVIVSSFGIGRFGAGNNNVVADWINISLCVFNFCGAYYLLRLLREPTKKED
jgi:hypothetical protein